MKRITYFLSGALAALLISSATVSAFAAGGLITLNVQPAQVMVNGEVFQPKDAQGRDALVFTYNGTTYAPVRALAEAYGLTVGYDSAKNMATVDGAARTTNSTGSFSSQWTVTEKHSGKHPKKEQCGTRHIQIVKATDHNCDSLQLTFITVKVFCRCINQVHRIMDCQIVQLFQF